jgi:hypothetical protein
MRKVLWIVDGDKQGLIERADFVRAQAVCVRTTNRWLRGSIQDIKRRGFDVYAWRWPSVDQAADTNHHYADSEATFALDLIAEGLDGYIVDPESDDGRASDDWNHERYAGLANSFCNKIKLAGRKRNPSFLFGTTSGCDYPTIKPRIPWAEFLAHSDAVYPQIYWAPNYHKAHRTNPDDAWTIGMSAWRRILPSGMKVVPIMGEIAINQPDEIQRFGELAAANNLAAEIHFYAYSDDMRDGRFAPVWDALRNLGNAPSLLV